MKIHFFFDNLKWENSFFFFWYLENWKFINYLFIFFLFDNLKFDKSFTFNYLFIFWSVVHFFGKFDQVWSQKSSQRKCLGARFMPFWVVWWWSVMHFFGRFDQVWRQKGSHRKCLGARFRPFWVVWWWSVVHFFGISFHNDYMWVAGLGPTLNLQDSEIMFLAPSYAEKIT